MNEKSAKNRPNLSSTAFWDIDFQKIDFDEKARFVIEKVLNYGLWDDIKEVFRYYGF
ncbi:DUF6922 domain-containing protein [Larkinella sp. VNQ87]|uniref:DUF6922 domain-containing protein n=1 Tax=Larkinella sp. VNQ87 TaxID=3400921 RepID=UPI003C122720